MFVYSNFLCLLFIVSTMLSLTISGEVALRALLHLAPLARVFRRGLSSSFRNMNENCLWRDRDRPVLWTHR